MRIEGPSARPGLTPPADSGAQVGACGRRKRSLQEARARASGGWGARAPLASGRGAVAPAAPARGEGGGRRKWAGPALAAGVAGRG